MCLVFRRMQYMGYLGIIQAGNRSQEKLEDDTVRGAVWRHTSCPIKRFTICLCMDAHFWFYMAEAPSPECQRASLPFCLHYELTNSRTVDIFLKIKSLFKIFEFSTLDLLSAACGVLSELVSIVLSDLGATLPFVFRLHWEALSTALWAWGSPYTPHSTQKLFPDLQGTSSFSTLPLRGQTTHPYLFLPSTHCLLCLSFLHSTSQGLQTLCVYA